LPPRPCRPRRSRIWPQQPTDQSTTFHLRLAKLGPSVRFWINDLPVLSWDDAGRHGPPITCGKIGFRQMSPMVGRYANLTAHEALP
jgi:hypothetical protein